MESKSIWELLQREIVEQFWNKRSEAKATYGPAGMTYMDMTTHRTASQTMLLLTSQPATCLAYI